MFDYQQPRVMYEMRWVQSNNEYMYTLINNMINEEKKVIWDRCQYVKKLHHNSPSDHGTIIATFNKISNYGCNKWIRIFNHQRWVQNLARRKKIWRNH